MMMRWRAAAVAVLLTFGGSVAGQVADGTALQEAASGEGLESDEELDTPGASAAEEEPYPSTFEALDTNDDGYISQEEAAENPHLVENWLRLDEDESGRLDRSEFAAFEEIYQENGDGGGSHPE